MQTKIYDENILKEALKDETEASEKYAELEEESKEFNCSLVFRQLAKEEMKHKAFVEEKLNRNFLVMKKKLQRLGKLDFSHKMKVTERMNPSGNEKCAKKMLKKATSIEKRSVKRYEKLLKKAKDENVKETLQMLLDQERQHLAVVKDESEKLDKLGNKAKVPEKYDRSLKQDTENSRLKKY